MNEQKSFDLRCQCEECKKIVLVSVKHKKEFISSNKQSIFLTYYDCPECSKRHFVQIDDAKSLQELNKVRNQFVSLANEKKKGKGISKKQSDKFKKARQHLAEYRMKLMEEFTGASAIDEYGNEYILRFSI